MKILNRHQIKSLDQYTIQQEGIKSIDLMERAALTFSNWLVETYEKMPSISLFCGTGNNGGDGLAVARQIQGNFSSIKVVYCEISNHPSADNVKNLQHLKDLTAIDFITVKPGDTFPDLEKNDLIIDAIFGSGLNRKVTGYWATLIHYLNSLPNPKVSIDIPSGLFADEHTDGISIEADKTFSFELPKLAFFFPENAPKVGSWAISSINLATNFIEQLPTSNFYLNLDLIRTIYKPRAKFTHKGTYGRGLLLVGSQGMFGAGILAARACLRSGVGVLTIHTPQMGYTIMQISIPEAMVTTDPHEQFLTQAPTFNPYAAIGIGCGIGKSTFTQKMLFDCFEEAQKPLVLDADALNLIAQAPECLNRIPVNSILTPHPKEFERLFGKATNDFERHRLQCQKAKELNVCIVLKGAHTIIATPDGNCYFNSTGNPGMASGGMGDALTGIITGLLAQGYSSEHAALFGVFIHGLAGDLAAEKISEESLIPSDLIEYLGIAFKKIASDDRFL